MASYLCVTLLFSHTPKCLFSCPFPAEFTGGKLLRREVSCLNSRCFLQRTRSGVVAFFSLLLCASVSTMSVIFHPFFQLLFVSISDPLFLLPSMSTAKTDLRSEKTHLPKMPTRKTAAKAKSHSSEAIDVNFQNCLLRINNGGDVYGMLVVQLDSGRVPKACELITQNIPSSTSSEKNKSKQGFYKNSRFIRLSKEGLQTGEVNPPPKSVPVAELDGELGRIPHGFGTVSLCRSSSAFDGSQFFVCLTGDPLELEHLNRKHIVFGRVTEGLDVLLNLLADIKPYVGEMGTIHPECPLYMAELVFASM